MDKKGLLAEAWQVRENAYAPYSGFKVGAALLSSDGRVFTGCNVENASYGLSCCAERVALHTAVAQGAREFKALALAGEDGILPCGACLQALAEFSPQLEIYTQNNQGEIITQVLNQLLPAYFSFAPPKK